MESLIEKQVQALIDGRSEKPTIAFGLLERNEAIEASLKRALDQDLSDIVLVVPTAVGDVPGFTTELADDPEHRIVDMLVDGEVDGIIRGTIDDFRTSEYYRERTGAPESINPGLMRTPQGKEFFLSPVSNPEGWDKESRSHLAIEIAKFVQQWGLTPRVAVFTGVRHETYARKKEITEGVTGVLNQTYEDAEWIVEQLVSAGYEATNMSIDLNPAVEQGYNIMIPVNGMAGNQIFRVVMFCGGLLLAGPRVGWPHPFEDNSRTETEFVEHVRFLCANIEAMKSHNTNHTD